MAVEFDGSNKAAAVYATKCDESAPATWAAAEMTAEQSFKFQSGTVVATAGTRMLVSDPEMIALVRRHLSGDWGEVDKEDAVANDRALTYGSGYSPCG